MARRPKLVLAVIDGCRPSALDEAIAAGRAPVLAEIVARGTYVRDAVPAFPSVTPVCATSIATGVLQDEHGIPSMNWFHREEGRYVEYGSSFQAARRFGFARQLTDTVYRLNLEHLHEGCETVFESLDDLGDVRTAGTTYLVYRGRHEHVASRETPLVRLAGMAFRRPLMGPKELFYADLFASRETGCWSKLGLPGARDQHAGCVSAWLAARDLFDFLLLSLPDNDTHSHEHGPDAQVDSIAEADLQLRRVAEAAGGVERFLDTHAVVVAADHSHALVEHVVGLEHAVHEFEVLRPRGHNIETAEIALCPAQRSAMLYVLRPEDRPALLPRLVSAMRKTKGVDVLVWRDEEGRGVVSTKRGQLRFAPGGDVRDARGGTWAIEGDPAALDGTLEGGELLTPDYPDALRRCWAALACERSGDLLLSAAPGWEFPDWGGQDHVGGGSHGSLHVSDSHGVLAFCGLEDVEPRAAWSITDVAPLVRRHFGARAVPSRAA